MYCLLILLTILRSAQPETKRDFPINAKGIIKELRHSKPEWNRQISILCLISKPICEPCFTELHAGWNSLPPALRGSVGVHYVSDNASSDDLASFGHPSVYLFHKPFVESLVNHILVVDTNGHLITSYKIGSDNGFDPAYQLVDSILLYRGIAGVVSSKCQPMDTVSLPMQWPIGHPIPLRSRFDYNSIHKWIELYSDTIDDMLCIDSAGSVQYHVKTRLLPGHNQIAKDTDVFTQFVSVDKDLNIVSASLRMYARIDTVIFGERTTDFFSRQDQLIAFSDSAKKPLIIDPFYGHFFTATDDVKHLWLFDDPSGLQLCQTAHILHINLANRSFDSVTLNLVYRAIPAMYFSASCGKSLYILPDSGKLVEIDTLGKIRFRPTTTGKLPGYRTCTFSSGASTLGIIQEVNKKYYAIFFNLNGRRITQPILLPTTPAYAVLLDSGILIVITQDSVTKNLKLYRSKIL